MKKHWIAVNLFGFVLIALVGCTINVNKELERKGVVVAPRIDTVVDTKKVVKLEKKVRWYKKQLKVERRENDSLIAEHIRKDGLLRDTPSFIRLEFTDPLAYLMNKHY